MFSKRLFFVKITNASMNIILTCSLIALIMTDIACSGHSNSPDVTVSPTATAVSSQGKIAFLSDRDDNAEIYIMNADGSNQVNITGRPSWDALPCLSPDGTKLAFSSDRDEDNGDVNIYIMDLNSSSTMRLTDMANVSGAAAWCCSRR